ncbi:unnamed protein product [Ceutorhynchus assimilis]|uniref:Synaptic plasticity regulator PANTS n=1 Tax=Ceutorhynchus assimilis TaxID=467358 RepID=A0A9N9MEP4_9CUCU|nr:unnamed protein product [Ceutorhynchus assimilis]
MNMTAKDENQNESRVPHQWMIKECPIYNQEYSDCTSIRARLHQWFVFGQLVDCGQWKRDSLNCCRWVEEKDVNAAKELIESEKKRRKERLLAHYRNNVWTKRKSPPENWNAPLPDEIQKEYESTYLYVKSKEMKGEAPPTFDPNMSFCTIM